MKRYKLGLFVCILLVGANVALSEEITEVVETIETESSYTLEETPVENIEQITALKEEIKEKVAEKVKVAIRSYLQDRELKKDRNLPDYTQLTHAPIDYINPLQTQAYPANTINTITNTTANNISTLPTVPSNNTVTTNNVFNPLEQKTVYAISYEEYQQVQAGRTSMEEVLSYKTPLPEQALYNQQVTYGLMTDLHDIENYYSAGY